jgi:hypothetical protein
MYCSVRGRPSPRRRALIRHSRGSTQRFGGPLRPRADASVEARSAGRNHKASLGIFWLKDNSLADPDNLPPPEVIAQEIVADLEVALEQFRLISGD